MSKDIEEIKKLEKDLRIKLKHVNEITPYDGEKKSEYVLNEKDELVSLALNSIQLKRIPELSFKKLTSLSLSNNQITKIENLDWLTTLQSLFLSYNEITKIENLDKLTALQSLFLSNNQITKIENLDKLTALQLLDLSSNQITKIENLDKLTALQSLYLRSNQIAKIENLDKLTTLQKLDLDSNQITKIENLDELISLKQLNLRSNQIAKIENLDSFTALNSLFLSNNQIAKIENLGKLTTLERLDLNSNQITKIENLGMLTTLERLDLNSNQITKIENLGKFTSLQSLNLSNNQIAKIENLKLPASLQSLNLSNNQITKIENLDKLTTLQRLYLNNNQISKIENLNMLTALQRLYLNNNQISKIENLEIHTLQTLYLSYNQISQIENLEKLTALQILILSSNQIPKIENLDGLISLHLLDLDNNQITKIENLDKLTDLNFLQIENNQITEIENLDSFSDLIWMTLADNPISEEAGTTLESVKNYLSKIQAETILTPLPVKVMFLGNHQSGKTTYLHFFKDKKLVNDSQTTHVLNIQATFSEDEETIPQSIVYDFGGQDYYHGLYQAFFTQNAVNVLFWCNRTNYNKCAVDSGGYPIRNFNLDYWIAQLDYYHRKAEKPQALFLVQTHANTQNDKRNPSVNLSLKPEAKLELKNEFYLDLVENNNPIFCKAGLEYLRHCISQEIKQRSEKKRHPKFFIHFIKKILESEKTECTPIREIFKDKTFYPREPLKGETDERLFGFFIQDLILLSERGLVLYYPIDPKNNRLHKKDFTLEDYVWLNPAKTIETIHKEVFNKTNLKNENNKTSGKLSARYFEKICPDLTREMLLREKIVFFNTPENTYILPGYLATAGGDPTFDMMKFGFQKPDFSLKFENFIPFGLINQLICWFGNNPDQKYFWRDQLIFTLNREHKVWIRLDTTNLIIEVFVAECKNATLKLKEALKIILFNIIDLYWGEDPYKKLVESMDRNELEIKSKDISELSNKEQILQWTNEQFTKDPLLFNDYYAKRKNIVAPNDMYLSVDGKNYVNYKKLTDFSDYTPNLAAKTIHPEDASRWGSESTVNLHMVKHLVNNENLNRMKKIFISYSRKDVDYKNELKNQLNMLKILDIADAWSCDDMTIGKWHEQIQKELEECDIIIYMLSANFFSSQYIIEEEVRKGIELVSKNPTKKILSVIVSDFPDLNKFKSLVGENTNKTTDAILALGSWQFLSYSTIVNKVTGNTEEKITPLKRHPYPEQAYSQIVEKIMEELKLNIK